METAHRNFLSSLERTRESHGLYCALENTVGRSLDLSDLLRGQVVMLVSCFDYYIHEIVKIGIKEIYQGLRPETNHYNNFSIPLSCHIKMKIYGNELDVLDEFICERHGYLSFQSPEKIADAVRFFSTIRLWDSISAKIGIPAADIKKKIDLYVDRRNKIAHEADIKPGTFGDRWPIDKKIVEDMREFIVLVGNALYDVVKIQP